MGIANSAEKSERETDTESEINDKPKKNPRIIASHFLSIFNNPSEPESYDSSDSDISSEDLAERKNKNNTRLNSKENSKDSKGDFRTSVLYTRKDKKFDSSENSEGDPKKDSFGSVNKEEAKVTKDIPESDSTKLKENIQTGGNKNQNGGNKDQTGDNINQSGGNKDKTVGNKNQTSGNNYQTGGNQGQTGGNQGKTGANQGQSGGYKKQGIGQDSSTKDISNPVEVMNRRRNSKDQDKIQRYSREPPERDNNCACNKCHLPVKKNSCHPCCIPANKKQGSCNKSNCVKRSKSPLPQGKSPTSRRTSDSFVGVGRNNLPNNLNQASFSKSAPINVPRNSGYIPASRVPSIQSRVHTTATTETNIPPPPPPLKPQVSTTKSIIKRFSYTNKQKSNETPPKGSIPDLNSHSKEKMYHNHYNKRNYNYSDQRSSARYRTPSFPYEEPSDSTTCYSCDPNCVYEHCATSNYQCPCQCDSSCENYSYHRNTSDDQGSCYSDSSRSDFMNLAYQKQGDYPELVDELENTLSQRNRERVQKTMERFEMLSRQNKNLDKPIFDDDESNHSYRQRHYNNNHNHQYPSHDNSCKCGYCRQDNVIIKKDSYQADGSRRGDYNQNNTQHNFKMRSDSLSRRPSFQPTPFPRNSGYVEKVARYMDPNFMDKPQKYSKQVSTTTQQQQQQYNQHQKQQQQQQQQQPQQQQHVPQKTGTKNGMWKMDSRKGEWVKVKQHSLYDFENNYPPLPPPPPPNHMYENHNGHCYNSNNNNRPCSCNKCNRKY